MQTGKSVSSSGKKSDRWRDGSGLAIAPLEGSQLCRKPICIRVWRGVAIDACDEGSSSLGLNRRAGFAAVFGAFFLRSLPARRTPDA
jgi:hypothetical protein